MAGKLQGTMELHGESFYDCPYHVQSIGLFLAFVLWLRKPGRGGGTYQTTEKCIKKGGRHLMLRRLFRSTSALVCIWELNVLYYGYIENLLNLTRKENHPCSICQRTAISHDYIQSLPVRVPETEGEKGSPVQVCTRRQAEHIPPNRALWVRKCSITSGIWYKNGEQTNSHVQWQSQTGEMNLLCILPDV